MKVRVRGRLLCASGCVCLLGSLALAPSFVRFLGINGFSPNQELQLPLLAPVGGPNGPVAFIVRGLEPGVRVDKQGTVYIDSIRGVPTGFDLHRLAAGG